MLRCRVNPAKIYRFSIKHINILLKSHLQNSHQLKYVNMYNASINKEQKQDAPLDRTFPSPTPAPTRKTALLDLGLLQEVQNWWCYPESHAGKVTISWVKNLGGDQASSPAHNLEPPVGLNSERGCVVPKGKHTGADTPLPCWLFSYILYTAQPKNKKYSPSGGQYYENYQEE